MGNTEKSPFVMLAAIGMLIVLPLLYIVSGQFMGTVNNTELTTEPPTATSHIIATTARMIEREVSSGFCPSAYIWPGHIRYDICGFQEGQQQVWSRVAIQLADHLSREGPTSDRDPDLAVVLQNINRPNTWSLLFSSNNTASLLTASVKRLDIFNSKLEQRKAGYYPRIDNFSSMLSDLTNLLGSEAQRLNEKAQATGLISLGGRGAYYHTLGTMAATCWILEAAKSDFADVLKLQSAEAIFDQAKDRACEKLGKTPTLVINGDDLSHLLTLAGAASATVNNLTSLQSALAAAPRGGR